MKEANKIANELKDVMHQLLGNCQVLQPNPTSYFIFKYPEASDSWFILLFFTEAGKLNQAVKNGTCYRIHTYFSEQLQGLEQFAGLETPIFFEEGNVPESETAVRETIERRIAQFKTSLLHEAESKSKGICGICHHDFNQHQLLGEMDEQAGFPTKGWMICPEENCNCFRTWDYSPK